MTNSEEKVYDPSSGLWTKPKDNQRDSSTVTGSNSHANPGLSDADYLPERIKTKVTERLVEELHDPSIKGMVLYRLCSELLDRIEGKAVTRAIVADATSPQAAKKLNARNEQIDRILQASRAKGIIPNIP
jgi:hypothetical protein